MTLGELIKTAREAHGLSQNKLAELSGISAASISRIEAGESEGRSGSIGRLARVLRIDPSLIAEVTGAAPSAPRSAIADMVAFELSGFSEADQRFFLHLLRAFAERSGKAGESESDADDPLAGVGALVLPVRERFGMFAS